MFKHWFYVGRTRSVFFVSRAEYSAAYYTAWVFHATRFFTMMAVVLYSRIVQIDSYDGFSVLRQYSFLSFFEWRPATSFSGNRRRRSGVFPLSRRATAARYSST